MLSLLSVAAVNEACECVGVILVKCLWCMFVATTEGSPTQVMCKYLNMHVHEVC